MRIQGFRSRALIGACLFTTVAVVATDTVFLSPVAASPPGQAAPSSTATSAYTADEAVALARRAGRQIEVTSATTPTDTMVANPNGSLTLKRQAAPVRKRVGTTWRNLDATLRVNGEGAISPALSAGDLALSAGGSGPLATMRNAGRRLSLTLPMALPTPILDGATATYPGVLPGVDLRITATTMGGFAQVFVVHDAVSGANPALKTLKMTTVADGLTVSADAAGALSAKDRLGTTLFNAAAPLMWDSAGQTGDKARSVAGAGGPEGGAATAAIKVKVDPGAITLTPDAGLLSAPGTVYPVYIDPPWTPVMPTMSGIRSGYASVAKAFPTSNKWNNTADPDPDHLQLGWANTPWHARTMVNFGIDVTRLAAAVISEAHIDATSVHSGSCTAAKTRVFAPSTTLSSSNATWDFWYNANLGAEVGSNTFSGGYNSSCPAKGVAFGVLPGVNAAVAAGRSTQTFVFTGDTNETSNTASYKELSLASLALSITYNHVSATPSGMTTSPATSCTGAVSVVGDGNVMLYAPVSDADGGVVGVRYEVWKSSAPGSLIASSDPNNYPYSSGSTAVLAVDQGVLRTQSAGALTEFSWRVQITDGYTTSGWSSTCKFTFDPTRPGAPGAVAPADGATHIGAPVDIAVTKPAGGTVPSTYLYQLNAGAPVSAPANASGNATVTIVPTRRTNTLTISAVSAGGNTGIDAAVITFTTAPVTVNAKDADLTGDGSADFVGVGADNGLPAGVWLATGKNNGQVTAKGNNIGVNGNGVVGDLKPTNFNGAQIVTGLFAGTGVQDVMAYYPATGAGSIIGGTGDGSALLPQLSGNQATIPSTELTDEGVWPLQVAGAGDSIGNGDNTSDLIGVGGPAGARHLNYYFYASPRNLQGIVALSATTPAGDMAWDQWRIATAQILSGGTLKTSLFLWKPTTGALHLWRDLDVSSGELVYQPFQLRAAGWNTGVAVTLQAADVNNDNIADLWTVGAGGTVTSHLTSALTGTTGTITTQTGQALVTSQHAWALNNATSGPVAANAAQDLVGTAHLSGSGNAVWHTGDLFSPSVLLNADASGTSPDPAGAGRLVGPSAPQIDTNASFSVSAWVKPISAGGVIASQDGAHTSRFSLYIDSSTGKWSFRMAAADTAATTYDLVQSPTPAQVGVWTQVMASFSALTRTMSLYVNGQLAPTGQHPSIPTWPATGAFTLGEQLHADVRGSRFSGQLSDVQAWNLALIPGQVTFVARANNNYVSAGTAGTTALIANRTVIGYWETFDMIDLGAGVIALRSHANGQYVTAESAGAAALIANRPAIGPWEQFQLIRNADGSVSLKALINGLYVCADGGGASPLIANRAAIGLWESFTLIEG